MAEEVRGAAGRVEDSVAVVEVEDGEDEGVVRSVGDVVVVGIWLSREEDDGDCDGRENDCDGEGVTSGVEADVGLDF